MIPVCLACQLFFDWHTWPPVDNQVEQWSSVLMNPCSKNPTTMIGEELKMSLRIPCRLTDKTPAVPRMRTSPVTPRCRQSIDASEVSVYIILNFDTTENGLVIPSISYSNCNEVQQYTVRVFTLCPERKPHWSICHQDMLRRTARRKRSKDGMPSADATTAKARAVVLRTYLRMSHNTVDTGAS